MDEITKDLEKNLNSDDKVVVATSGGPDSMALLSLVCDIKDKLNLTIICAHVNHKMRIESEDEKIMVEEYCKKRNIIFEYMEILEYSEDNFHNDARKKRYQFFETLIHKYKANYLFTAHHADDLAETILMRMMRGSTLKGYAGFPKVQDRNGYKIVRPFIIKSKEEIDAYCDNKNIPYAIDGSNQKDTYTRNRFRKYIIPALKEETNNFYSQMYKFSKTLLEYDSFLEEITEDKIKEAYKNKEILIDKIKNEKRLIQKRLIQKILEDLYKEDLLKIDNVHVDSILGMIYNLKPNMEIDLPNEMIAQKHYDKITFEEKKQTQEYKIEIKEKTILPDESIIQMISSSEENSNFICRLNKSDVSLPLYVRNKKDGDKMNVKNMEGTKKIKKIFIENKIDSNKRKLYPVVVDSEDKIVWIPGLKKSQFDKQKEEKCDIILKYTLKGEKNE